MLAKKNRLVAEKDFARLFSKGKSWGGKGLGMKVLANREGHPRIGFVVSTKVAKLAVDRNRLKRRLREIMRPLLAEVGSSGVDVAIMARSEAVKMTFDELRGSMKYLFEKAGLVSGK